MVEFLSKTTNLTTHIENLRYAQIIQQGLLPKKRHFDRLFTDSFCLYQPCHIVSGDFYWVAQKDHYTYLAVGDCTGHGVSGAMLSVLASSILNYSILNKGIVKTHRILQELDKHFLESFSGQHADLFDNDWLDIGLVCISRLSNTVHYSGAKRKMIIKRKSSFEVYHGDPFPIGGWQYVKDRTYTSQSIPFETGDKLYLYTDGYHDQLGGERDKKFSTMQFYKMLEGISVLSCEQQYESLVEQLSDWKGNNDQTDDICVVGIEL